MATSKYKAFRQQLLQKEQELVEAIARLDPVDRIKEETGVLDFGDRAASAYNREAVFQQVDQDRDLLKKVREALRRIKSREYGKCLNCGRPVEERRLEAVPWARYCIACQELHDGGLL